MTNRLTLDDDVKTALVKMVDGNPGAVNALISLVQLDAVGFVDVFHLDDMGIYGPVIHVGFKYVCGSDPKVFRELIRDRSIKQKIIETGSASPRLAPIPTNATDDESLDARLP